MEVAGALFLEQGFAAVNMSQISAALGGSKATLYNHFPSKELLFQAVMLEEGKELFATLAGVRHVRGQARDTLVRFGSAYLRLVLSPQAIALNRLAIGEAQQFPAVGRIFYETGFLATVETIVELMEVLKKEDALNLDDTRFAALIFKSMVEVEFYEKCLWGVIEPPGAGEILDAVTRAADTFLAHFGRA